MTKREDFIKKWNEQSFSEFQSDLTALIASEIEKAGKKKEPFVGPFIVESYDDGMMTFYKITDINHKLICDGVCRNKHEAEYICQLLNRE